MRKGTGSTLGERGRGANHSLKSSALTSCHSGGGEAVGGGAEGGLVGGPVQ